MRSPPGPPPSLLLGNLPIATPNPLELYRHWAGEFGDIFYYRALWKHVYFLNHPEYIEYVLVRNARNFIKDPALRNLRWLLGEGLLTSEGDHWKHQRRLIQPAFHRHAIARFADTMTGCTQDLMSRWRSLAEVDIHREMMQLTLRIVVRCLFGVDAIETSGISSSLDLLARENTGLRILVPAWVRRLPLPGSAVFNMRPEPRIRRYSRLSMNAARAAGLKPISSDCFWRHRTRTGRAWMTVRFVTR